MAKTPTSNAYGLSNSANVPGNSRRHRAARRAARCRARRRRAAPGARSTGRTRRPRRLATTARNLVAELEADAAQEQQPQHDHQRQIETAEAAAYSGKHRDERSAGGEQPHLVAVPDRADAAHRREPLFALRATNGVIIATPRSKPSSTTYTAEHQREQHEQAMLTQRPASGGHRSGRSGRCDPRITSTRTAGRARVQPQIRAT